MEAAPSGEADGEAGPGEGAGEEGAPSGETDGEADPGEGAGEEGAASAVYWVRAGRGERDMAARSAATEVGAAAGGGVSCMTPE